MKMFYLLLIIGYFSAATIVVASVKSATVDRSHLSFDLEKSSEYNQASFVEIYTALERLKKISKFTLEIKSELTGVGNPSERDVEQWQQSTIEILTNNLANACRGFSENPKQDCVNPRTIDQALSIYLRMYNKVLPRYSSNKVKIDKFYYGYFLELLRLSMLFNRTTSEISKLKSSEINGFELADGNFLLTFDDGPRLSPSTTSSVIAELNRTKKQAAFFVTANKLKRLDVADARKLYRGHCVYSHGNNHQNHTTLESWQASFIQAESIIEEKINGLKGYIRPPYGQRNAEIINFVEGKLNSTIMLWNIDSQDWRETNSAEMVSDRVLTLMLLWRRGIILFHDTNTKSIHFLKKLENMKTIQLLDCHSVDEMLMPAKTLENKKNIAARLASPRNIFPADRKFQNQNRARARHIPFP